MTVILALDPARKTGVAVGAPGQRPVLATVNFSRPHDEPEDVFARAMKWIERALDGTAKADDGAMLPMPTLLAIEAPIPPSKKTGFTRFETTLIAIGLSAIFRGAARGRGIPIKLAPISAWRKQVLMRGNLNRDEAKQGALRLMARLGWPTNDTDAAEAGCIWLFACASFAPRLTPRTEPLFLSSEQSL